MTIIRSIKDRTNPYVQINKTVFDDPLISLKAKGFIGYCLSKPDDWIFHVDHLAKVLKEKHTSILNVIKECIDHGYAIRWRMRAGSGMFQSWQTIISDSKEEILRVKKELNSDPRVQSSFSLELKKKVPQRGFPLVDNPVVDNRALLINNNNKNKDICNDIIIADPSPPPTPPDETKPAGGNNNNSLYKSLEKAIDLSPKQKLMLMKFPEPLVNDAIRYCYHPSTQITGGPLGRMKLLQHFLRNPDDFKETLHTLDKPKEKESKKDTILGAFKNGQMYNGYEYTTDDIGVSFCKEGMYQAYTVRWDSKNFNAELDKILEKTGIK